MKSTKNKSSLYNPNKSSTNCRNKDIEITKKNEFFNKIKPPKLISTIKKVISQKMNNLSETNSNFDLENDSNNSIPIKILILEIIQIIMEIPKTKLKKNVIQIINIKLIMTKILILLKKSFSLIINN